MRMVGLMRWTLVVALCAATGTAHAQWGPETPMSATGGDVFGEGLASSGSTLHMIYGTSDIRYRRSADEGATWSTETTIGSGTIHLTDSMVADGNDVWVVYLASIQNLNDWCCSRDLGNIWLRRSRDGGMTWDAPLQLSTPVGAYRLSIAYAANRVHLVWMDYRSGAWDTYYRRSPDRGTTWDPEVRIAQSTGPFGAERPQIAARGDSVHVTIWDDRGTNASCMPGTYNFPKCPDVFHVRSVNGGQSWGPIVNVANGGVGFAGRNDIAVAGTSNVIINYNVDVQGETGSKLFAVASSDDGQTWATPIRLTFSANASDHGSIIGGGNAAYLAWHDDRDPTNREIFFRRTPNGGASWDPEEQVSSGAAGDSSTPLDAVTPGYAHVMWIDNRGGTYQVYYRRRAISPSDIPDAGAAPDAATTDDASVAALDAGPDGNTATASAGGGCDCQFSDGKTSAASPLVFLAVGLWLARRQRRGQGTRVVD